MKQTYRRNTFACMPPRSPVKAVVGQVQRLATRSHRARRGDERFRKRDERAPDGCLAHARRYPSQGAGGTLNAAEQPTSDGTRISIPGLTGEVLSLVGRDHGDGGAMDWTNAWRDAFRTEL